MDFKEKNNSSSSKKRTICLLNAVICTVLLLLFVAPPVQAQLSPGKLAQAHKNLEGLKKCGKCHKLGSQDVTAKCLDCHQEIQSRQSNKKGLHAGQDFNRCVNCHVDHQGRDFDLIHWPDGRDSFDHKKTGHQLMGAHQKVSCRQCHKVEFNQQTTSLTQQGTNLARTYLGLSTQCLACHKDPHQKQFADGCITCHDQNKWQPAPLFSHNNSKLPLTGMHKKVACNKCHISKQLNDKKAVVQYTGLSFSQCTDCHADPHKNSFGSDCTSCHDTSGWLVINGKGFDHNMTDYKLVGLHNTVRCEGCHSGNRKKPLFDNCSRCHRDTHNATGLKRKHLMQCDLCHDVMGFKPSTYNLDLHQKSEFPLQGAHRAVSCQLCHTRQSSSGKWDLKLPFSDCRSCHKDPHRGGMNEQEDGRGCASCHNQNNWLTNAFDHDRTAFKLTGTHKRVTCAKCHGSENRKTGKTECGQCHSDPHNSQFNNILLADKTTIDCQRCHVTVDWFAELFDHETDSRFPLRGGHLQVACTACHQAFNKDQPTLLRYKPLSIDCVSCHKTTPEQKGIK
ncbi:MAG: hypothetical protein GY780_00225 [bacterium]|nr:hypothetical protein [bacterium]